MNAAIIVLTSVIVLLLVLWWKRKGAPVVPINAPTTQTPLNFNGVGYVTYPAGAKYDTTRAEFSCKFKTKAGETEGLITGATAEDSDHFIVRLVDGKVVGEINTGDTVAGPTKIKDPVLVNDNAWHKVTFTRDKLNASLSVDDGASIVTPVKGTWVHITRPNVINLGGAPKDAPFKGCIKDVTFNGMLIPDAELTTVGTGGVTRGCA